MGRAVCVAVLIGSAAMAGVFIQAPAAGAALAGVIAPAMALPIPQSVRTEHESIHATLVESTKVAGPVGEAAGRLAKVLHPHFIREEQIALPPLGLLARLARGDRLTASDTEEALAMTDALRRELPGMLDEHKRIREAVAALRAAAVTARAAKQIELAEHLALHAQTEEEVLYPAAILVGDVIRARAGPK